MTNSDVALPMESLEKNFSRSPASSSGTAMGKSDIKNEPQGSYNWNMIFIVSCLLAVLLDPLFLYIPIINEDMKCIKLDRNMKIAALFSRSVTDLFYIVDIIFQIYRSKHSVQEFRSRSTSILVDILAVLPLPHVFVLIFFSKMRSSSRSLIVKKVLNFLVMMQYVPRVLPIYLSCEDLKKTTAKGDTPTESKKLKMTSKVDTTVVKGLLNFYLYIFASHVFGAVWYFYAFDRITTCWLYACRNDNECESSIFDCHDHRTFRNLTFINDLCPINLPNATLFDFGMYLNILQSGLLGSTNFPQKLSNCFWWGLRNVSSLGQNLQPSIDTWENLFAVSISIHGLLIFIYLIGNLQTYMQLKTTRSEKRSRRKKIEKKKEEKEPEIEAWLSKNGIPSFKKEEIMKIVEQEFKEDRDVDVKNIISILPYKLRTYIKERTPLARLKLVSRLQNISEQVLEAMSEKLKPKTYRPGEDIIEMGEPLKLLFIVHGRVSKIKDGVHKGSCGPLECYGEEELEHLENLVSRPFSGAAKLPVSKYSVLADDDVEALVLTVEDLVSVLLQFGSHFGMDSQW